MTKVRLSGIVQDSIVDGPGIRMTIFAQGCPHHCEGCHNPQTHDFNGGKEYDTEDVIEMFRKNSLLSGITLSGGEPFSQAVEFVKIATAAHEKKLNVITYSGYTIEKLMEDMDKNPGWRELLEQTDILVDGAFILAQRDLTLRFRGSKNQRFIDCDASLKAGVAVEKEL